MFQTMQLVQFAVWVVFEASVIGCVFLGILVQVNKDLGNSTWENQALRYCFEALVGSVCVLLLLHFFQ